jgi:hypothetical protein
MRIKVKHDIAKAIRVTSGTSSHVYMSVSCHLVVANIPHSYVRDCHAVGLDNA